MTSPKPKSRRAQAADAERVLLALLRTPKSRAGLIAAVTGKKISRHFVYGWISNQLAIGAIAQLKSTRPPTYQNSTCIVQEHSVEGYYPSWLEPRALPQSSRRRVFSAGRPI